MLEGAAVRSCWVSGARDRTPVSTILLALGPVLVPAVLGLWHVRRLPSGAIPFVAALVVGLVVFYLVSMGGPIRCGSAGGPARCCS